jgi:type II secretory pathway pseudopilin PulG
MDRHSIKRNVSRLARRLRSTSGYTLVELLVALGLTVVVVGVPMTFVVLSIKQQNVGASRAVASTREQLAIERLTRDLQQVVPGTTTTLTWSASSATVSMTLPLPGTEGVTTESVLWSCAFSSAGAGTCSRSVNSGAAVKEISNVELLSFAPVDSSGAALGGSTSPYTASNPAYVGITAKVLDVSQLDTSGTHAVSGVNNPITVQSGVALLNNSI